MILKELDLGRLMNLSLCLELDDKSGIVGLRLVTDNVVNPAICPSSTCSSFDLLLGVAGLGGTDGGLGGTLEDGL